VTPGEHKALSSNPNILRGKKGRKGGKEGGREGGREREGKEEEIKAQRGEVICLRSHG
jgi:hypothetical protein